MPMPLKPDDVFSRAFEDAGAYYAAAALEQQATYTRYQPPGGAWSLSYDTSMLRIGEVTVHQSPLGSLGHDGSWLWAWGNERTHPPGVSRLGLAVWLRDFGERNGIYEFVEPRLELAAFADPLAAAERLATVALGALRTRGFASCPLDNGARAFVVVDDAAVPEAGFDRRVVTGMFDVAVRQFPYDPRQTVTGYLARHGFTVREAVADGSLHAEGQDGMTVAVRFTEEGLLAAVSVGRPPAG
ncbi:hypothetical protein G3I60_04220 [Streptomyces sp. SID13666]|uniref:DUF6882 domain-containing protein n=1 Tax=unclassified Streptomyces TaxID=2593676 RepID=UPI0013BF4B08|nr:MULTISPECIES: DUF6882 domain-containing protein [unclassified Streptomyces]NEA53387.1 hypothetical protein [Streptomyces sp. SID13666]NEA69287.1 hypothetical protein [Streptomyces sp. SID13588]